MSSIRRTFEQIELEILQSLSTHQYTPISHVTLKAKIAYAHLERVLAKLEVVGYVKVTKTEDFMGDTRVSKICLLTTAGAERARYLEEFLSMKVVA